MCLTDLSLNQRAKVTKIKGLTQREAKYLADLGLVIGTEIKIVCRARWHGPLEIHIRGSNLVVSEKIAQSILIELINE